MGGEIKRDMSFTSRIQLEMKSNEFWTSPWQQLRLINHYSEQIHMHFMNPRLNLHVPHQTEFPNRRRDLFEFCLLIIPSPPVSSVWWAQLFVQVLSGHGWPLLADTVSLRSHARDGAKTRKRESHIERICCQLPLISSSDAEKEIQRTKTARIFQTLDLFLSKLLREDKLAPSSKMNR